MIFRICRLLLVGFAFVSSALPIWAQLGNSGSIEGVVKDQSGGSVSNASV